MIETPCMNCSRRSVGCHNEETCPEWAQYVKEKADRDAKRVQVLREEQLLNEYQAHWFRRARRWRKRRK